MNVTYNRIKRLIENKTYNAETAAEMMVILDTFLMAERFDNNKYLELVDILETKTTEEEAV